MSTEHNPDNLTPEQVGEGWRLLRVGEEIQPGDELDFSTDGTNWRRNDFPGTFMDGGELFPIRRRITPDAGKDEAQTLILEETPELQSAEALREYKERTKDAHIGKYGAPAQQPAEEMPETADSELSRLREENERLNQESSATEDDIRVRLVTDFDKQIRDLRAQLSTERTAREQAEVEASGLRMAVAIANKSADDQMFQKRAAEHALAESESREHQLREALNNIGHACGISGDRLGVIQALASQALLAPTSTTVADLRKRAETAERERDAVVKALTELVRSVSDVQDWSGTRTGDALDIAEAAIATTQETK